MYIDIQIERWPIERLIPRINNPRTHNRTQIANIAASIQEFGWTNPILVGAEGDIIAGHARVLAARKLGMEQVPVIVLKHLSPAQRRALVIAKPIAIERNVWIAAGATIVGGVTVGENSVVAAGSVVTKDVPPNTLVGGNPARVIRSIGDD